MTFLHIHHLWILLGVIVSLVLMVTHTTKNRARVPFRSIFWRASPRLVLFCIIWFVFGSITFWALDNLSSINRADVFIRSCIGLGVGLIIPQVNRLRGLARMPSIPAWIRLVGSFAQEFSEIFELAIIKMLLAKERKIGFYISRNYPDSVIETLYSEFSPMIVEGLIEEHPDIAPERIRSLANANDNGTRIKALMRFWGCTEFLKILGAPPATHGMAPDEDETEA